MKRRNFLIGSAGCVTAVAAGNSFAAAPTPCVPPTMTIDGNSTLTSICDTVVGSDSPAWLQGKSVNAWFQIPGTALANRPPGTSSYSGTPTAKLAAWNGAALKRQGSTYLIGAAGGHADYSGNEVNALTLSVDNPAWVELRPSTPLASVLNSSAVYLDYRRAATHTYYGIQFVNQDNRLAILPAPGMGDSRFNEVTSANSSFVSAYPGNRTFCSFSLTTGDWDAETVRTTGRGHYADWPGGGDFTACLCCMNPATGDIYYSRNGDTNGRLWKWTRATNSWSTLGSINTPNYSGSAIDPQRGTMLAVGDYGSVVAPRVYRIDTGERLNVTFGGLGGDALKMGAYPGVVFDEHNDRFLVIKNSSPLTIYAVNPTTWAVSILSTTGLNVSARQNGVLNAAQYVPQLKGLVLARNYSEDVYFLRLA